MNTFSVLLWVELHPCKFICWSPNPQNLSFWSYLYQVLTEVIELRWGYQFAEKGPWGQSYGYVGSHVRMWELDHKEDWVPKNWYFQMMVLEKTLESPLDCKETQPVHPKENQSWTFTGRTDDEAETPVLWPPDRRVDSFGKTLMLGKAEGRKIKGNRGEDGWMASLTQ